MFLKKFCFLICAIFLFENLSDVIKDSQSVQYINPVYKSILDFSFCIKLNEDLVKDFKNSSNNQYQFTVKELVESTCNRFFSILTCYNLIDLNRSYLFNYHSCLVFKGEDFNNLIRNLTNIDFKIFAIPNILSEVPFFEHIYSNNVKLEPFTLTFDYTEYNLLESPYKTNCFNYSNENINFKTKEIVFSKTSCLYECFKTGSRSLSYYYSRRDDKPLLVHEDELNNIQNWKHLSQNLTIDLEKKCLNECKRRGCSLRVYLVDEFKSIEQYRFILNYTKFVYSTEPSLTKNQAITNFISLIVLFLNISFFETIPYLIKKTLTIIIEKYFHLFNKYLRLFNKYYWILRLVIFILCLSIIIYLSLFRIYEYLTFDFNKLVAFNFSTEINPFYLMVCVPVQILIDNHSRLDEKKEKKLLNLKSFTELENLTDFNIFESGLERICVQYASIEKEVDYSIDKSKIVFRYFDYEFENYTMSNFLLRCYKIDLINRELRYEMLYSLSKLKIILKFHWYIIYPIFKNLNLTTSTINLIFEPFLVKRIFREKYNCLDYSKDKSFSNLSDKENAINQCVNKEHLENYGNLTIQSVIYKNTIPSGYKLDQVYFNQSIDPNISSGCRNAFKTQNCLSQNFEIKKRTPVNQINAQFRMNLYYVEFIMIDNIILSLSDLLLNNLLSFESIFIGLNIGKILFILFILLKRYKFNRIVKYYNYLKFIILLIGLSIHLYYIIDDILNGGYILLTNYFYSKTIQFPNLIFCFEIQNYNKIDFNHKQTSCYLDEFTKNLNLSFFKNVSLLDENYKEILFLPYRIETLKYLDQMNTIYFLNLKCFEFAFKLIDNERYHYNHKNFLSFKFNKKIISKYYNRSGFHFYLISRKNSTNELNGIEKFNFNYRYDRRPLFKINQKLNILEVREKYAFFHNPLSFLYDSVNLDDTTEYINQLLDDLKKLDLKSKKLFTNSIDFNCQYENAEFDDEMFDQYFYQIKNVTDFNSLAIPNYKREIYITKIVESNSKNDQDYDMRFYFNPLQGVFTFTNRDNYSKFIISILNCLNLWLNFCCLDFYIYLNKLCNLIYKLYQLILSFKFYLKGKKLQMLMQNL